MRQSSLMRFLCVMVLVLALAGCGGHVDSSQGSFVDKEANTGPARIDRPDVKEETSTMPALPHIVASGRFNGAGHTGEGIVELVERGAQRTLQLRGFRTDAGPDLKVWLANDEEASKHVNLGPLKEIMGDQSYEVPKSVDIYTYPYVLIWCEEFSVLFASARLS